MGREVEIGAVKQFPVEICRLLRVPVENLQDAQRSLGTISGAQELSFAGQPGTVGTIVYGWIRAIEVFMEH